MKPQMTDKQILEYYAKGRQPKQLMEETDVTQNRAYRIYRRYRVFKNILQQNELMKDLILSLSQRQFERLKAKYGPGLFK